MTAPRAREAEAHTRGPERPDALAVVPLIVAAAVVPLVVKLARVPFDGDRYPLLRGWYVDPDLYSWYKSRLVWGAGALAVLAVARYLRRGGRCLQPRLVHAAVLVYAGAAIASWLRSPYPEIALRGWPARYEGLPALLGYLALFLAATTLARPAASTRAVLAFLLASAAVVSVVGLLQYAGHYLIYQAPFRRLVFAADPWFLEHEGVLWGGGRIIATLFNSNYVGSYAALVFPLALVLFLTAPRPAARLLLGAVTGLLFALLVGCESRAGLVGGLAGTGVALVGLRSGRRRLTLPGAGLALGCAAIWLLLPSLRGESPVRRSDDFLAAREGRQGRGTLGSEKVLDISIQANRFRFLTTRIGLVLVRKEAGIAALDADGKPLEVRRHRRRLEILDPRYDAVLIRPARVAGRRILDFVYKTVHLPIVRTRDGFKILVNHAEVLPQTPEVYPLPLADDAFSDRAYVWKRTVPLLRRTLVTGRGPDTFALDFPQLDFVGRANVTRGIRQLISKPHNLYLQIAHATGLVSLIAVLGLFAYYLASSARCYLGRPPAARGAAAGLAVFAGVTGYLIAALANDSVVSVAPVFWVLLGLGFALNRRAPDPEPSRGPAPEPST